MSNTTTELTQYDKNLRHCKSIADDLEDWVAGNVYRDNDNGQYICLREFRDEDAFEEYLDKHDTEELGLWDYFEDSLYDIKYTVDSRKEFCSVCVMVACGGPNIYIDTDSGNVELYWWGDRASYPMSSDVVQAVDEYFEELYNC